MEKQKNYYSVKEAAKIIGVSTNTVYKYLEEGSLKGRRLNSRGRFKIPLSEIAPYLAEKETVKVPEEHQAVDQKRSGWSITEIALGVVLGILAVNLFQTPGEDSDKPSLLREVAVATWEYSGRTSTGFGNLADASGARLIAAGQEASIFLASRIGSRQPAEEKAIEAPQPTEEAAPDNLVLISVPGGGSVNLREEATSSSKVVAKIEADEVGEKTAEEGEWTLVAINQFPAGWVNNQYVETSDEVISQVLSASTDDLIGKQVVVGETPTGWLRVRAAPGGEETGKVYPGDTFELVDISGEWFLVEISTDQNGWISSQYASIQSED